MTGGNKDHNKLYKHFEQRYNKGKANLVRNLPRMFSIHDVIAWIEDVDKFHFPVERNAEEARLYSHLGDFFAIQESIPGIDPDSPRQYAKKNFPKNVAAAIIEAPFNKKAPNNTKLYKG